MMLDLHRSPHAEVTVISWYFASAFETYVLPKPVARVTSRLMKRSCGSDGSSKPDSTLSVLRCGGT